MAKTYRLDADATLKIGPKGGHITGRSLSDPGFSILGADGSTYYRGSATTQPTWDRSGPDARESVDENWGNAHFPLNRDEVITMSNKAVAWIEVTVN